MRPGDKLFKEVWAGTNEALYKKKKGGIRLSLGIFNGSWSFLSFSACVQQSAVKHHLCLREIKERTFEGCFHACGRQTPWFVFEVAKIAFEICSYKQLRSLGKKKKERAFLHQLKPSTGLCTCTEPLFWTWWMDPSTLAITQKSFCLLCTFAGRTDGHLNCLREAFGNRLFISVWAQLALYRPI